MLPPWPNAVRLSVTAVYHTELVGVTGILARSSNPKSGSRKVSNTTVPTAVSVGAVNVTVATAEVTEDLSQDTLTMARYWLPLSASVRLGVR